LHSTQYNVNYSEIVLKFAIVVSAIPFHSQGNNPYILEGTEAFTLLVTFLLHYDYIFPEIKEFPLYWNFCQKYFYVNKYFTTINCNCNQQCKDSVSYRLVNFYPMDGQDWLHFGFKTHHITISTIIPHRPNNFKSQDFNHYPFLNYIYIIYIFSTVIIMIFNCDVVAATKHNTTFVPL
jgi:hypothetical protein